MKSKKNILFFLFFISLIFSINSVFALTASSETAQVIGEVSLVIILLAVTIIGIIIKSIPMTIIGCFCCMALGIYTSVNGFVVMRDFNTSILGVFLLGFGMFWGVKAGLESIGD